MGRHRSRRSRLGPALAGFGGLALAWALLHPGLPTALAPPVEGDMPRYVGFRNLAVSGLQLRGYLGAIVNLPLAAPVSDVPASTIACGVAAALIAVVGVLSMKRRPPGESEPVSLRRVVVVGLLITIPSVILPSFVINRWVSYYACLPAIGVAIILGILCARLPPIPALALCLGWLTMGVVTRGMESSSGILNERSFLEGARAGRAVEEGFRKLHPTLPSGTQVLVSVASSGMLGIHGTLVDGQAPRIWYGDPSLRTLTPERRLPDRPREILVRVTSEQRVVEILPDPLEHRASDGGSVHDEEVHMVVRTYARGLAASGETARSTRILESLAERDRDEASRSQDLRLAAMAARAGGVSARAESLLAAAPPISRDLALEGVARILAQPTRRPDLDSLAYWAFGVSPEDPEALRSWMAMFYGSELYEQALHMAKRLLALRPDDPEVEEIARRAKVRLRFMPVRD